MLGGLSSLTCTKKNPKLPCPLIVSLSNVKPEDIIEQGLQLWEAFLRLSVVLCILSLGPGSENIPASLD